MKVNLQFGFLEPFFPPAFISLYSAICHHLKLFSTQQARSRLEVGLLRIGMF